MITKEYGKFVLVCDCCYTEYKFKSYDDAIKFKRNEDWKSKKYEDGEWIDICPECKETI